MESRPRCGLFPLLERQSANTFSQTPFKLRGSPAALRQYTVKHNEVLSLLINWLWSCLAADLLIYADLPGSDIVPVGDLFNSFRPDIAVADDNSICTLELTVCHETNLISSRNYKHNKYKDISACGSTLAGNRKITSHTIEISTLGFMSNISDFIKVIRIPQMAFSTKQAIITTVLKSSFGIYCKRNNAAIEAA